MKKVTIGKNEYDDLIYPAISTATNNGTPGLRTQCKILDKLEAVGRPLPVSRLQPILCDQCRTITVHEPAKKPPPQFELRDAIATEFEFEDAEAEYIVEKMEGMLSRVQGRLARNLPAIMDALTKEMDDVGVAESAKKDKKLAEVGS